MYLGETPTGDQMLTQCFVKPVKKNYSMQVSFPFMSQETLYETLPGDLIIHLIGHEGEGSILDHLKIQGLADGLITWFDEICPADDASFFLQKVLPHRSGGRH